MVNEMQRRNHPRPYGARAEATRALRAPVRSRFFPVRAARGTEANATPVSGKENLRADPPLGGCGEAAAGCPHGTPPLAETIHSEAGGKISINIAFVRAGNAHDDDRRNTETSPINRDQLRYNPVNHPEACGKYTDISAIGLTRTQGRPARVRRGPGAPEAIPSPGPAQTATCAQGATDEESCRAFPQGRLGRDGDRVRSHCRRHFDRDPDRRVYYWQ